jgi:signal transduction histidine kinase/ActR/RegA family two-component response regulator
MIKSLSPGTIARLPEIAAVLLAAVIGATAWLGFEYRQEVAAVQHTLEVEKNLSRLLSTIQDAETGNRGFLLTGDDEYLRVYDKSVGEIEGKLEMVRSLTADNAEQQRALINLKPVIENRFTLLKEGIELRRRQGLWAAVQFIQSNRGHNVMLLVRAGIAQLQEAEADLLRERSATARRLIRAGSMAAAGGIVLVFLSVAGWIWNQRRDARRLAVETAERERAEAQIRQMQKIEAVGQLTGGIAHDFNNMLAVVISGLSLIKRRLAAGNTDVLDLADATMDGANRAAALTSRLMAFARQQPLTPQPVDANQLAGGMAEMINRALGETIRVEFVFADGLWSTHADPPQLESALLNLCVNARDAMPDGGKLTIETSNCDIGQNLARQIGMPTGQYICIAVGDTGSGMAPDIVARAFDPFFTTKGPGKGTGLGLSQVHGFVKQSGGHIKIYSEPGHGTSINIYLPRHDETGAPERPGAAVVEPAGNEADRNQVILVVEDDARVRELSVSMLRELGYAVIHADGAAAALRQIDNHPEIALMFTDVVMPDTNGRELADQALLRRPELKILFTTGFTRDAIVRDGVPDSGVNFITKPFSLDRLAAKIVAALANGAAT